VDIQFSGDITIDLTKGGDATMEIVVDDVAAAVGFYSRALGGVLKGNGNILRCVVAFGGLVLVLIDRKAYLGSGKKHEEGRLKLIQAAVNNVENVETVAVGRGARRVLVDLPDGRVAAIRDPFGVVWQLYEE